MNLNQGSNNLKCYKTCQAKSNKIQKFKVKLMSKLGSC